MNKPFTLYHSGRLGVPNNCLYPHSVDVVDEASMKKAVSYDYVAVAYADGYRNNENFLHSNCLMLDCDNDHSEDPAEWVTPDMLRQALPGVCFAIHYSRNHNRVKGGRAARPKFHCFFPILDQNDPEKYKAMKQQVQQLFPFFDPNAVDAARFFFGTNPANVELFDGEDSIEDVLMDYAFDEMEMAAGAYSGRVINEGSRNNTMSHFAGRILKRYGDTEAAYNAFIAEAEKCSPPLDPQELNTITAVKTTVSDIFNGIKDTATSVWNAIKTAITTPIENAKEKVRDAIDAIKGFFSGLKLELPHIKLPHFSISGSFSLSPPSVPHINIDWYKSGGIMAGPTIFGMNGSSLMAGGEAGKEAILPLTEFYTRLESILTSRLNTGTMERYLAVIAANSGKGIYLDDGTLVGHLLPAIDSGLANYSIRARRGNR